jgi:crotonobetainyl-CoA:carnitine CoA-transferase CaiB-like acyl-CoA transferase
VFLTEEGEQLAARVKARHLLVVEVLRAIGVPPDAAEQDAEGIEHVGTPLKFTREPGHVSFAVPGQGEHTAAVLGAAGFTAEEIVALQAAGALG